jgi:hypothetical protein
MKLNVKAFALTCGSIWGFAIFLLTWWIIAFEGSTGDVTLIGRIYLGYNISPTGSIIGLVWAFIDGLLFGALFSWFYNFVGRRATVRET